MTVKEMIDLGKEVYVVPHNLTNPNGEGNLKMINDGANVIWNLNEFANYKTPDILLILKPAVKNTKINYSL